MLPKICVFCGTDEPGGELGVWNLSDAQADAQGRPHGAKTLYRICPRCLAAFQGTGTVDAVPDEVEDSILYKRRTGVLPIKIFEGRWVWNDPNQVEVALALAKKGMAIVPIPRERSN
jgi:hypothetical protein